MSRRTALVVALIVSALAAKALAQSPANPGVAGAVRLSDFIKGNILASAEQMPEPNYAFQPTSDVRTFGAILGHVANSNYLFCSQAAAEANPSSIDVEKTVTAKADLVAALRQSFAYCDKVLGALNDAKGAELVKVPGGEFSRLSVIAMNTAHNFEHYGNLSTYLRIKGLVPPSSQPKR
jgi:uncharacterized damage-inducible protein DinB